MFILSSSLDDEDSIQSNQFLAHEDQIIDTFDTSEESILEICLDLNVTKSRGPDNLPPALFKNVASALCHSLSQIFNKIKQTCVFPQQWKTAIVTPIHKKGDKRNVTNYRHISLLDISSKILERCMFRSLYNHFKPLIHNAQFGFRKGRSAEIQLLIYLDHLYKEIEYENSIDVIYTDFEKAFDKVDHGILLFKLFQYGVRGKFLKLIKSYLNNRSQRIKVGDKISGPIEVTSGVPQGSVLGALLFLFFINDLPSTCADSKPLLLADDSKFIRTNSSTSFQSELSLIYNWSVANKMPFNVAKCTHINFGKNNDTAYNFNGEVIPRTDVQKDLGILVRSDLKWNNHFKAVAAKSIKVLHMLKRNTSSLPVYSKLNLYKSMVVPSLLFGSNCCALSKTNISVLENVQKKFCKWCLPHMSYTSALTFLNIIPVAYYIQLNTFLLLRKIVTDYFDYNFSEHIQFFHSPQDSREGPSQGFSLQEPTQTRPRVLRHGPIVSFTSIRPLKSLCEQNFWFQATRTANRLPDDIDIFSSTPKSDLLKWFWEYFHAFYNERNSCSWVTFCDCNRNNCRLLFNRNTFGGNPL